MTPDWLATEDGRKMVDAVYPNLECGCWSSPDPTDYPCKRCVESSEAIVVALDRMFRERYAAALEAEANRRNAVDAARFLSPPPDITLAKEYGWRDAVAFLRREPTNGRS